MAISAGTAFVTLLADMSKFASSVNTGLTKNQASLQKTGKAMTKYLTVPILAAGAASVKMAADFEAQLNQIQGLAGQSAQQVAVWRDQILKLSPDLATGPQELAKSLYFVASSGVDASKAMDVVTVSAKASAAGLGDAEVVADAVTSAMNAYAQENLSAAAATDVLTAAVREGKGEASQIAPVLGSILPIASELGVSFNDVGAAIAAMTRTGDSAALASTKLNAIFSALLKTTPQAEKAFDSVGLNVDELRASLGEDGLLPTLELIKGAVGDNTDALAEMFPNVRALRGILSLTGGDAAATAEVFDNLANSTGSTDEAFKKFQQTAQYKFQKAVAQLQTAAIQIGSDILPAVEKAAKAIGDAFAWIGDLPEPIRHLIELFGGVVAAIGPVVYIAGRLSGVLKTMSAGWKNLIGLLANPWVDAAIGAVIVAKQIYDAFHADEVAAAKFNEELVKLTNSFVVFIGKGHDLRDVETRVWEDSVKAVGKYLDAIGAWGGSQKLMNEFIQRFIKMDPAKGLRAMADGGVDASVQVDALAKKYNQGLAQAVRDGNLDLGDAITGWKALSDVIGVSALGDGSLEGRVLGVVNSMNEVDVNDVIAQFKQFGLVDTDVDGVTEALNKQTGEVAKSRTTFEVWDHSLDDVIKRQALLGHSTREDVIQQLLDVGAPLSAATDLAGQWTKTLDTARVHAKRFAGLTVKEFDKWKTETVGNFEDFVFGATKMKDAFNLSTHAFIRNIHEQEKIAEQGAQDIQDLTSIKNIDPAFEQWLVDQGPAAIHAFIGANEDGRKDIQDSWTSIEGYVGDVGKALDDLPDADVKLTADSTPLQEEVQKAVDYLHGQGFTITSGGEVNITGQQQHAGGFAGTGPVRDLMNLKGDELLSVLQRGEFVVQRDVATKPGVKQFLEALNGAPTFHQGGFADGPGLGQYGGVLGYAMPELAALAATLLGAPGGSASFTARVPQGQALMDQALAALGFRTGAVPAAWGGFSNGNIPLSSMVNIDGAGHYLAPEAAAAFFAMQANYGSLIRPITSAYRSYSQQVGVYAHNTPLGLPAAPPGQSMHGWGKALDLGAANALGWMRAGNSMRFNWRPGDSFGDPAHFSYGVTAKKGFRGVLQHDTQFSAHRGEFANIQPTDEPMTIRGDFQIKDWKTGLGELKGELDWLDRSPRGRNRR